MTVIVLDAVTNTVPGPHVVVEISSKLSPVSATVAAAVRLVLAGSGLTITVDQ